LNNKPNIPVNRRGEETPLNRAYEVRRDDDTFKLPKITIYDVDFAIMYWLKKIGQASIDDNGRMIDLPVVYGAGEKWVQVQKNGFLRDTAGKLMSPICVVKRESIAPDSDRRLLNVNDNPSANNIRLFRKRTPNNDRYDLISKLANVKKTKEFYVVTLPEFIDVSYEVVIWTDYMEQMNHVIEDLIPTSGYVWGDTWQFVTTIDNYNFETIAPTDSDRLVKCNISLNTKAMLLDEFEMKDSNVQKAFSLKRIVWNERDQNGLRFDVDNFPSDLL
jgi:hypothetical protein